MCMCVHMHVYTKQQRRPTTTTAYNETTRKLTIQQIWRENRYTDAIAYSAKQDEGMKNIYRAFCHIIRLILTGAHSFY